MELYKSKFTVNESPVYVYDYMSGKMEGIPSISTSCLDNPICQARMRDGDSVCAKCIAAATLARYDKCHEHCLDNLHLLMSAVLDKSLLPRFANVCGVRIESFGDVGNVTHAINYANIAYENPRQTFAWWTKNANIVGAAFDIVGKPSNVILIESSEKLNEEKKPSNKYVDKVFTVYEKAYIIEHGLDINCGGRKCLSCWRCYQKNTEDRIHEQLK